MPRRSSAGGAPLTAGVLISSVSAGRLWQRLAFRLAEGLRTLALNIETIFQRPEQPGEDGNHHHVVHRHRQQGLHHEEICAYKRWPVSSSSGKETTDRIELSLMMVMYSLISVGSEMRNA